MRMSAGDVSRPPVFGGNIRQRERMGDLTLWGYRNHIFLSIKVPVIRL
jgi:hypothetical protein